MQSHPWISFQKITFISSVHQKFAYQYNQSINKCNSKEQYLKLFLTNLETAESVMFLLCIAGVNVICNLSALLLSLVLLPGVTDQ